MDYINCITRLRPKVTWKNNIVNGFSLETISETYQHADPMPTEQECVDIWPTIEAEIEAGKQREQGIADEQNTAGFKGITVKKAKDIIKGRYDTVRALPVSGASNAETIANIEAKIDALIAACEWVDKKEAVYLLR